MQLLIQMKRAWDTDDKRTACSVLGQKVVSTRTTLGSALTCSYLSSHESTSVQYDQLTELAAYLPTTNQINTTRTTSASQLFCSWGLDPKAPPAMPSVFSWDLTPVTCILLLQECDGYHSLTNVIKLRRLVCKCTGRNKLQHISAQTDRKVANCRVQCLYQ